MSVEKIEVKASKEVIKAWREHLMPKDDEGLTVGEIADALGLSDAAVRSQISRNPDAYIHGTATRITTNGRRVRANVYRLKK